MLKLPYNLDFKRKIFQIWHLFPNGSFIGKGFAAYRHQDIFLTWKVAFASRTAADHEKLTTAGLAGLSKKKLGSNWRKTYVHSPPDLQHTDVIIARTSEQTGWHWTPKRKRTPTRWNRDTALPNEACFHPTRLPLPRAWELRRRHSRHPRQFLNKIV